MDPFFYLCFMLPLLYCLVCFLEPRDHLLGKGWPLGFLACDILCVFVTLSYGVLGQVWYFIVSIPDL